MNNQKDEHQKSDNSEKPQYIKPEVVATYSQQEIENEFAHTYGQSFVDLSPSDKKYRFR